MKYYLRTGTCKFGASCKFHHPRDAGVSINVLSNSLGYPLRPVLVLFQPRVILYVAHSLRYPQGIRNAEVASLVFVASG